MPEGTVSLRLAPEVGFVIQFGLPVKSAILPDQDSCDSGFCHSGFCHSDFGRPGFFQRGLRHCACFTPKANRQGFPSARVICPELALLTEGYSFCSETGRAKWNKRSSP